MPDWALWVPLIVSGAGFALSVYVVRQKAGSDYVGQLEKRIVGLEKEVQECQHERNRLLARLGEKSDENVDLMRRLLTALQPGTLVVQPHVD